MSDKKGLILRNAEILRQSITSAKSSEKFFKKGLELIKDALKD